MKAAMIFADQLADLHACEDAVEWVGNRSLTTAWAECERGDWMLWLAGRMVGKKGWPTRQQVVLAACACAELAPVHVPAGEDRPRLAIETARHRARGTATLGGVRDAADAYAAEAAYAAFVAYAATTAAAAEAATPAADAYAAAVSARTETLKRCADICREMLQIPAEILP